MSILIIDNYDSFTYNLVHYVHSVLEASCDVAVIRNDTLSVPEILALRPSHIIISPGPCSPNEAGVSIELARCVKNTVPLLGVCLGHQAIGQAFGAEITHAQQPIHGKTSSVSHSGHPLFRNIPSPFHATRYHSLAINAASLPDSLEVIATNDEDGEIMGIAHRDYPRLLGVQFHPESILTQVGKTVLSNFLALKAH